MTFFRNAITVIQVITGIFFGCFVIGALVVANNHEAGATFVKPPEANEPTRPGVKLASVGPYAVPKVRKLPPPPHVSRGVRYVLEPGAATRRHRPVTMVSPIRLIEIPGRQKLLRFSYEDFEAAVFTAFYEARGIPGRKGTFGWTCVVDSMINRALHKDHPNTLYEVSRERNPKTGKYYYSPYNDPRKRRYKINPKEEELLYRVAEVVAEHFNEISRGDWKGPCTEVYAFHSIDLEPNEFFQKLDPVLTVKNKNWKGEWKGHVLYADNR